MAEWAQEPRSEADLVLILGSRQPHEPFSQLCTGRSLALPLIAPAHKRSRGRARVIQTQCIPERSAHGRCARPRLPACAPMQTHQLACGCLPMHRCRFSSGWVISGALAHGGCTRLGFLTVHETLSAMARGALSGVRMGVAPGPGGPPVRQCRFSSSLVIFTACAPGRCSNSGLYDCRSK